ncbi:hypothetical protein [Rudanella lutea]|uniref:hypothetical protein n=1 Tax=Rudanella lutea TaxID=451374 RepID=UPI0003653ABE|nr:hypothetical protein [Rudanella lutea]
MKTSEYQTSGILEAYLLDLVSETDRRDVEQMISTHPDLQQYMVQLSGQLAAQFGQGLVPPPPSLREQIALRTEPQTVKPYEGPYERRESKRTNGTDANKSDYVDVQVSNTHIQVHKYWRAAFIAVFILSKIFLVFGLYYYFKAQSQAEEIQRLNQQMQQTPITAPR